MNRVIVNHIKATLFVLFVYLSGGQTVFAVTDDCQEGRRWVSGLYDESLDTWDYVAPEEFFTPEGAKHPNYDETNANQHPYFFFNDTTCSSKNWSIRFTGYSQLGVYGEALAVVGINVEGPPDPPTLGRNPLPPLKKKLVIKDTLRRSAQGRHSLRGSLYRYEMGFDYHDDTIYFYRNGYIYRKERYEVCKVIDPNAYWEKLGGYLTNLDYWDYQNGTEYHEDFSDCSNTQEFPECEPEPPVTIEAEFELPNCSDSTLRLKASSNLLTSFKWIGPNGFSEKGDYLEIDYNKAKSGKYLVWGKLNDCSTPVYTILDIKIPKLKKDSVVRDYKCHGDTTYVGDKVYTENGIYRDTLKTAEGCDSVVISVLNFKYREGKEEITICKGQSFQFGDRTLTTPGVYKDTVKVPGCNCDSIVILTLLVDTIRAEAFDTICQGRTYVFGDTLIKDAGVYEHTFKTPEGCDSLVTLSLFTTHLNTTVSDQFCKGGSYIFGDTTLTQPGTYVRTFKTEEGCDSVVKLILSAYSIEGTDKVSICKGSSYLFGDTLIKDAGTYVRTLKTDGGCDSVVTLTVTTYTIENSIEASICQGSTYLFGDTLIANAGTYTRVFKTEGGCDSVVTLSVDVFLIEESVSDAICKGGTYIFGDSVITKPGTYTHTFKTPTGCDSVVTLTLTPFEITETVYENICVGNEFTFGDRVLTRAGTYIHTFKTEGGCDSTVTLHLTTTQLKGEVYDTICRGETYTLEGKTFDRTGTYNVTTKNEFGCDSIITLHLFIRKPLPPTVIDLVICKGDTFTYNSHEFTNAGNIRDTLSDIHGCDSIVVYHISYAPQSDTTFVYRTCSTDPVLAVDGKLYDKDTSFSTLLDFEGYECKLKTSITVITYPAIAMEDTSIHLCGKHRTRVVLDSIRRAKYHWLPEEGIDNPYSRNVMVTFNGDEAVYKVELTNGYCSDTALVTLTYTRPPVIDSIFINQDGEELTINVSEGKAPYYYQIDTTADWHNSVDFGKLDIGVHTAYVKDQNGCTTYKPFHYYIPVVPMPIVTPNGDGVYDTWEIKNLELYDSYTVKIYNRWGKLLKSYDSNYDGWDGYYNGAQMPSTDYWYTISVDLNEQFLHGHFTLLRQ